MYRQLSHQNITLYCPMWPCDRDCGRFHERFISTTKLRKLRSFSDSTEIDESPTNSEATGNKFKFEKPRLSVFDEIMEMAAKKNSTNYVDAPLPPLPEKYKSVALGKKRVAKRQSTIDADTTMIFFDNPVWDDAKFRRELLDSDEEDYYIGDPPSNIIDDDETLDAILKETTHDLNSNPTSHYQLDESILSSDDDDDYNNIDLSRKLNGAMEHDYDFPKIMIEKPEYEKSLTDV